MGRTGAARRLCFAGAACWAAVALLVSACALAGETPITFARDSLVIRTAEGAEHRFVVELATSPEQRARGLMYRERLAPDAGMLFVYRPVQEVAMWMRNTAIPLDMLFIAADGRIVRVVERTVPYTLATISSGQPVRAVLEINGGSSRRLGIALGDRVVHAAFETGP